MDEIFDLYLFNTDDELIATSHSLTAQVATSYFVFWSTAGFGVTVILAAKAEGEI